MRYNSSEESLESGDESTGNRQHSPAHSSHHGQGFQPSEYDSASDINDESDASSSFGWMSPAVSKNRMANPQSPGEDIRSSPETLPLTHQQSGGVPSQPRSLFSGFTLLTVGCVALGMFAMFTSQSKLQIANAQIATLMKHKEELSEQLGKFDANIRHLQKEIVALDVSTGRQGQAENDEREVKHLRAMNEMSELKDRLHTEAIEAVNLKKLVQRASRDDIIAKYGDGSLQVEFELIFPEHHRGATKFVVEMAPAEVMPHSVHTFLEMVSNGLLDGCSFILNAMHVLKAAPLPFDGSSAADKARAFAEKGLESVAFKEYNEEYPHQKYTIGFAADGSPSFYINTENNTEIHAGDPCFGRVISGFDAIRRLEATPTRNGIWFERRIGIKYARIISTSTA